MSADMAALMNGPAGVPPAGTIPQLDDPPNSRAVTDVLPPLSIALATLLVAMRMYTTVFITRRVGIADYSLVLGLGCFIGFATMCIVAGNIAPGVHMWDLRLKELPMYLYYLRVGSILYAPTIFLIKLSILSQYIQVFMPNKQPRFLYWSTIILIGGNLCSYLVLLIMQIWSCNPIRKSWDPFVVGGSCIDVLALNVGASTVNVVSDSVIFLLPQAIIWRLHMPTKQKLAVSLMFFIAILAIASAAVRLHYTIALTSSTDQTWYTWIMGVWALIEMDFGIIVACLPAAGAFFRSLGQSSLASAISSSLRGMTTWKRMSAGQDGTAGYSLEDRKHADPYLDTERSGSQKSGGGGGAQQGISWVKTYGVSGLDTLATVDEPGPVRDDAGLGQRGYQVSVERPQQQQHY